MTMKLHQVEIHRRGILVLAVFLRPGRWFRFVLIRVGSGHNNTFYFVTAWRSEREVLSLEKSFLRKQKSSVSRSGFSLEFTPYLVKGE
jgi:hypothetical protein